MNENLSAALLRAGLTVEDVAAGLDVDPKTVRRWLDGRLPFLRHRWGLAAVLGVEERELWPALRAATSRPVDVRAIYPRLEAVPRDVWVHLFESAEQEIDILDDGWPFVSDLEVMAALGERVCAGVRTRICLVGGPDQLYSDAVKAGPGAVPHVAPSLQLRRWGLAGKGDVQLRYHQAPAYNIVYRADDQLLVSHRVYGARREWATVIRLQQGEGAALAPMHLAEFERVWAESSVDGHRDLPSGQS